MTDSIFISHAHQDFAFCRRMATVIEQRFPDANIYLAETDVLPGDAWVRSIQEEVIARPCFIVVLSATSVRSPWVREETSLAFSRAVAYPEQRRRIIPIQLTSDLTQDDIDHLAPLLSTRQILLLDEKAFEAAEAPWERLLQALAQPIHSSGHALLPTDPHAYGPELESARRAAEHVHEAFVAGRWPEVETLAGTAVRLPGNTADARLRFEQGVALLRLGKIDDGLNILAQAEELNPHRADLVRRERFKVLPQQMMAVLQSSAVIDHDLLFGVAPKLAQLRQYLAEPMTSSIVSITGEGGIGKTALAFELVTRYASTAGFTRVAWVSVKQRYFATDGTYFEHGGQLSWIDLLGVIARQLGLPVDQNKYLIEDGLRQCLRDPATEPCLIVVDNLETLDDAAGMVRYFAGVVRGRDGQFSHFDPSRSLLRPHKALITTRDALHGNDQRDRIGVAQQVIREYRLGPLEEGAALDLIRHLGKEEFVGARDDDLRPIYHVAEGNPFLIRLIVMRYATTQRSLADILHEMDALQEVGSRLVGYLYGRSLEVLQREFPATNAQDQAPGVELMEAFCYASADRPLSSAELRSYCLTLDNARFQAALERACDLGLIRASRLETTGLERAYAIHSLLRQFICNQL